MLAHYDFVNKETLAYFSQRRASKRDSDFALDYVKNMPQRGGANSVIAALEFKTSVLWAQLDALWMFVDAPSRPEPGCRDRERLVFRPPDGSKPVKYRVKTLLPRGVRLKYDETRSEWLLLAPERVIKTDAIAVES